jgi:hypothetical protein
LLRNRAIPSVGFAEEKNTPRALLFSNVYSSLVAIVNLSLCQIRGDEQNTACLDPKLSRRVKFRLVRHPPSRYQLVLI